MRTLISFFLLFSLFGCGAESVGAAATVAKLQAEQAKQGKADMEKFKASLDDATKASEENLKRAEEAGKN